MKAETAKKAIDKFCAAGPERLARTQRHSSTGIAGFADEFKGYVVEAQALSESENPHSYCSKGVLDSFSKTCSAAFYAILGRGKLLSSPFNGSNAEV